tara:strand:+ start:195 stop:299 length:105 start_codon:yes stop_codon:yes gene_type:complete
VVAVVVDLMSQAIHDLVWLVDLEVVAVVHNLDKP